ncbi:MAG: cold-shock protein [Moraxellaceae bacterium]|nr:MAG: cold-shock protein [Moraxellaceae bacterium]
MFAGIEPEPVIEEEPVDQQPQSDKPVGANNGVVKWFSTDKGYGFIQDDDGSEVFVHFRSIVGEGRRILREGQNVTFDVVTSDKGPQADNVRGA